RPGIDAPETASDWARSRIRKTRADTLLSWKRTGASLYPSQQPQVLQDLPQRLQAFCLRLAQVDELMCPTKFLRIRVNLRRITPRAEPLQHHAAPTRSSDVLHGRPT